MRKKLLSILALAILVTSTLVGCSEAPSNSSTLTILSITEGEVFVMKAGTDDWTEATVEMTLAVGDTVKTGDDSGAEITFFDGSTIELEAGTQIEITSLSSSADTGAKTITLMQTIGTTISRVTKLLDPASSYAVETPSGVAAVRGTIMIVRIVFDDPDYEDGTVLITSVEGHIYFIGHGEELQLPEGAQVIADSETAQLVQLSLAVDDGVTTHEDTPVAIAAPGVLGNDSGLTVGDTLTVTAVDTIGTVGNVTAWAAEGSFAYDPSGQFEYLEAGNSTTDSFTYTVTDDYGITDTATVTITINGVYDAPPYTPPPYTPPAYYPPANHAPTAISLDTNSVAENQPVNTIVDAFSTTDPDTGNTFTYTLVSGTGDTDNGSFNINDGNLRTSATFDYETKNSYTIRVRSTDQGTLWFEKQFTISVTDVNEPPTNISLSSITVAQNKPVNTIVGAFSTTDPDSGNTFTYTLVSGTGDTDNGSFNINGSNLRTSAVFDYETKNSYTIRVRSTDQGALWFEKEFTISVSDVNEPPTNISLSSSAVAEDQPANTTVGAFSTTDPDIGSTFTYTLVSGAGDTDNGSFDIDGNNLRTSAPFDYETKNSYTIRVRSTDQGALWFEKEFTISVTNVNEPPTNIGLSSSTVPENQLAGSIVGAFSTTDPDSGNTFTYALVSGTGDTDNGSFDINNSNLRTSAMFDYETKNSYSIRVRSTDQGGLSLEEEFTISVTDLNEPPTDISLSSSAVAENQPANTAVGAFSTTDPDSGNTFTYTLVSGLGDTDNGSFNIDGNSLRTSAMFDYETQNSYSIRVRSTDQGTLSVEEQFTITVTDVVETTATIGVTVDQGPTAPIYISTDGGWAIDEDTGLPVNGQNHVASAQITVAGGHSYCVWVGGDVTRYVKNPPASWSGDGTETACGYAAADSNTPLHFKQTGD
ncbi:MAG: cadherin domain-containing protein [Dehalococcoidia bacterium]